MKAIFLAHLFCVLKNIVILCAERFSTISTFCDADGEHVESPSASHEESYSPAAENPLRRILQVLHFP